MVKHVSVFVDASLKKGQHGIFPHPHSSKNMFKHAYIQNVNHKKLNLLSYHANNLICTVKSNETIKWSHFAGGLATNVNLMNFIKQVTNKWWSN